MLFVCVYTALLSHVLLSKKVVRACVCVCLSTAQSVGALLLFVCCLVFVTSRCLSATTPPLGPSTEQLSRWLSVGRTTKALTADEFLFRILYSSIVKKNPRETETNNGSVRITEDSEVWAELFPQTAKRPVSPLCLFVCLLVAILVINHRQELHKACWRYWAWAKIKVCKFWFKRTHNIFFFPKDILFIFYFYHCTKNNAWEFVWKMANAGGQIL